MGMDMYLANKVVVVTGASKGIGLAISQAFADAGAFVIAGARNNSPELKVLEAAGSAIFVTADLSTPEGPRALIAKDGVAAKSAAASGATAGDVVATV
jgi:NAD(P)-dependent dehydrogenase (short-subunit alcohol dehydrogenase family)